MDTADEVDLLCAFVKWYGLRVSSPSSGRSRAGRAAACRHDDLHGCDRARGARSAGPQFGAEVKIQYDAARTRLHAKAWLFHREHRFDTAYVGSSNLSTERLLDGVEWNVRLLGVATPTLLQKFRATFDTYWNRREFEPYDPDAIATGSTMRSPRPRDDAHDRVTISLSGLEVRPFPYQEEMLDAIESSGRPRPAPQSRRRRHRHRQDGHRRARTTGDSARAARRATSSALRRPPPGDPRAVAATYREVLADADFGELTSAARGRSAGSTSSPAFSR